MKLQGAKVLGKFRLLKIPPLPMNVPSPGPSPAQHGSWSNAAIVLAYTISIYYVFRGKVTLTDESY